MSRVDEARYGRACLLLLNVCPFTLRHVIDNYSLQHGSLSLFDFLEKNKHSLFHLCWKKCCCNNPTGRATPMYTSQWELLFMKNTSSCSKGMKECPCRYNARQGVATRVMDVTMCCLVINNVCPGVNVADMNTIREIRNNLIHAASGHLDQPTFTNYWKKVKSALLNLASHVSQNVHRDTLNMIDELHDRAMNPDELEELRKTIMDERRIKDLEESVTRLVSMSKSVSETTDKMAQISSQADKTTEKMTSLEDKLSKTADHTQRKISQLEKAHDYNEHTIKDHGKHIDDHDRQFQTHERRLQSQEKAISDMQQKMEPRKSTRKLPKFLRRFFHGDNKQTIEDGKQIDNHDIQFQTMERRLQSQEKAISDIEQKLETRKSTRKLPNFLRRFFHGDKANIRKLTKTLMKINNNKTKTVQLSPLQDRGDQLPLDLLFASVVIIEDHKYDEKGRMSSKQTREVTDQAEIFDKDGEEIKKIYMLGDAAHGKTTFCLWLVQNWCNVKNKATRGEFHTTCERAMGKFDFVFLVQFRNVDPNIASVTDMICDDLFRDDTDCHTAVRHVLSSDKYKSLIIMDGLDEWNPNEKTREQLKNQGMPNIRISSTVSCFISMRPWLFALISKLVNINDRVLEIVGLSESGMKSVIKNVLLHHYELKDDKSQFKEKYNKIVQNLKDESLKSFMQIPLLAVVCVQIWYNEKQLGKSMTCLYAEMLNMLIERAYEKHNLQLQQGKTIDCEVPKILTAHENIKNCISLLLQLGKVAYEGLLSDERNLVFEKRKLEKEIGVRELQFALDVGLISQKEAHSLTTKNVSVHFFHKTIQDFLAVIYIVINKDQLGDSFCKHLSNIKVIMQLSNAIMFICYMCPALGNAISQRVVSMTDEDIDICQYRESPSPLGNNTVEELYKLQVGWYRELQSRQTDIPVTDIPVTSVPVTDIPVTSVPVTDIPVTGVPVTDIPVTCVPVTDIPVTGVPVTDIPVTERPMIFHISDVYLGHDCDIEAVKVTRELLSDSPVDIRSLSMYKVPSVADRGITDTELSGFLCSNHHNSRSLVMINITDKTIHQIYIPSLRYLYLYEVRIDNTDRDGEGCLPFLKGMKLLRVLALCDVNLGDRLLNLSDMTSLRVLELHNVNLGDSGLDLTDMVSLKELRLSNITLSNRGLDLSDMTSLLELRLSRVTLGYRGLELSDIISLRVLKLENVTLGYRGLDLSGKTSLIVLTLWNVTLGDRGLDLSDTTSLRVLKLSGVILGYRGLDLTNKTCLRKLVLADVNVGKNGLDLSDLKSLCVLELNGVTLGKKGLNLCAEMEHIEMVRLDDNAMLKSHWSQFIRSVLQIRHRFNVELVDTDIDIESMTKIRSCPDFNVTQDGKNKNASYEFDFTRVWPLSHIKQ